MTKRIQELPKISRGLLVFLIVAAIDSIRNLPAAALFGGALPLFFLVAALIFLVPVALLSAEFSSRFSEKGGIFHWVSHAFGPKIGLLAIWFQWINTMVWYPTILLFLSGTIAYLIDPLLAENRLFLVLSSLFLFWSLTLMNLQGLHLSAKINQIACILGTLMPMALLILLASIWLFLKKGSMISFSFDQLFFPLKTKESWVSLVAIMASFLGMELSGVHVQEIENPEKNFPKAMSISVLILLFSMLFGSLSIAVVIPADEIRLVDGIMQTMSYFFSSFHLKWLVPVLALLILVGSFGGMINWLIAPAKGLLHAAKEGFLPDWFQKENASKVPVRLLLLQALLVSFFSLLLAFVPSINSFYWFFMALSTALYMMMYLLMFFAALRLKRPKKEEKSFQIPKGMRRLSCILGIFGAFLTIGIGFLPPEGIDVGLGYPFMIGAGIVLLVCPVYFLWGYKERKMGKR